MVGVASESELINGTVCTTDIPDDELTDVQIRARLRILSQKGGERTEAETIEKIHLLALCNRDMLSALSKI